MGELVAARTFRVSVLGLVLASSMMVAAVYLFAYAGTHPIGTCTTHIIADCVSATIFMGGCKLFRKSFGWIKVPAPEKQVDAR